MISPYVNFSMVPNHSSLAFIRQRARAMLSFHSKFGILKSKLTRLTALPSLNQTELNP